MDLFDYISRVPSPLINKIISTYFSDVRIGAGGEVWGGVGCTPFLYLQIFFSAFVIIVSGCSTDYYETFHAGTACKGISLWYNTSSTFTVQSFVYIKEPRALSSSTVLLYTGMNMNDNWAPQNIPCALSQKGIEKSHLNTGVRTTQWICTSVSICIVGMVDNRTHRTAGPLAPWFARNLLWR